MLKAESTVTKQLPCYNIPVENLLFAIYHHAARSLAPEDAPRKKD